MFKLKVTAAGLLVVGLLASSMLIAGLFGLPQSALARHPGPLAEQTDGKSRPAQKPSATGTLLLARDKDFVALTPEGKHRVELSAPEDTQSVRKARLSPDGAQAAFVVVRGGQQRGPDDDQNAPWPIQVVIRKLGTSKSKTLDFPSLGVDLCWAPEGKRLAVTRLAKDQSSETVLLDPETGKKEPLNLLAGAKILDWSRDGETFLLSYPKDNRFRLGLAAKGEKEPRELVELKVRFASFSVGRFSPDGKKVLFTDADPEQKDAYKWSMSSRPHLLDIASKKRQPLPGFPGNACCTGVAWSPDGKRVAYTCVQLHPELLKKDMLGPGDDVETEAFLVVADVDGKNTKTISSEKSTSAKGRIFWSIDWR
jgi:Tol biopolymer transport system component